MNDKDLYEQVDFIQENMQIYSFSDFVDNCYIIKALFSQMKRQEQKLYQWYLFASSLSYKQKQIIWNYLNEWIDYRKLIEIAGVEKANKYYMNMIEHRNENKLDRT